MLCNPFFEQIQLCTSLLCLGIASDFTAFVHAFIYLDLCKRSPADVTHWLAIQRGFTAFPNLKHG